MSTIDHLLAFDTEAAALATLPAPFVHDGAFNLSCVFPGLALVTQAATWDAEGNAITPQTLIDARFWLLVSIEAEAPDAALIALPGHIIAANRELALAGQAFIYPQGLGASPEAIASVVRIDGLPAGSAYPFQTPAIISSE